MLNDFPVQYIDPVYRPPSEARSFILPVTNGCSWNRCSFCEMYQEPQKRFSVRREADLLREIEQAGQQLTGVTRVFLADGDAMVLSARRLEILLEALKRAFPDLQRVGAYCLPRNLASKTVAELIRLRRAGLKILYVGVESGDDEVLTRINKGETAESTLQALAKIRDAGMTQSVMVLNGLGGRTLSEQHALNSADLINKAQPDYLSTLVLTFHRGPERFIHEFGNDFIALDNRGVFQEMHQFIGALNLSKTVFRSDHISNCLPLKGVLGRDKERLLTEISAAIADSDRYSNIPIDRI